jgi:plastocyanin
MLKNMVNELVYCAAASIIAILGFVSIGASTDNSVFAQGDKVQASIVYGATSLTDTAYTPNPIETSINQTVIWTNDDFTFHTVTSGSAGAPDVGKAFDSGLAGPTALSSQGKTFEHTFDTPGEYPYFCILHPEMVGTVIVK